MPLRTSVATLVLASAPLLVASNLALASDEVVLSIGVSRGGRYDAVQSKALQEHLQHAGEAVASARLSHADKQCNAQACFEQLAQREGAALVLSAQVQENAGGDYYSTLVLFDVQRRVPIYDEATCEQCSSEQLSIKLGQQSDALLRKHREGRGLGSTASLPVPEVPTVPTVPLAPSPGLAAAGSLTAPALDRKPGYLADLSLTRKILAGTLVVASVGLLIPSGYWASIHGKLPDSPSACDAMLGQKCSPYDQSLHMGLGFSASGLLLGGAALLLFLPSKPSSASNTSIALRASFRPLSLVNQE